MFNISDALPLKSRLRILVADVADMADMTLISAICFAKSKRVDVTALQFCSNPCVPENGLFFSILNDIDDQKNDSS